MPTTRRSSITRDRRSTSFWDHRSINSWSHRSTIDWDHWINTVWVHRRITCDNLLDITCDHLSSHRIAGSTSSGIPGASLSRVVGASLPEPNTETDREINSPHHHNSGWTPAGTPRDSICRISKGGPRSTGDLGWLRVHPQANLGFLFPPERRTHQHQDQETGTDGMINSRR